FTELEGELEAELQLRQKQYKYYLNKLFKLYDDIEKIPLNEIAKISRGKRVIKKQLTNGGIYPVYQNSLTPMGYYNEYNSQANTTYIISAGSAGEIGYSNIDFWAADDCLIFSDLKGIENKYIYYFLLTKQNFIRSNVWRAGIPRLSRTIIERLEIPIPPLEEQKRIVGILDKFDELVNDISLGIPAEIQMRKKQYEYYRDKLLRFEEAL
ncbi:restriction endonuclease subunit S, partial [Helicobacter cappadocius]